MGNSPLWAKTGIPQTRGTLHPSRVCLAQSSAMIPRPLEISGLVSQPTNSRLKTRTRIGAMLCCESSPGVQPGCGSCLAWRRFREFSNHPWFACRWCSSMRARWQDLARKL